MAKSKHARKTKKPSTPSLAGTTVKLKARKHLLPPLAGIFVFLLVFGVLNSQWISGRIAYYLHSRDAGPAKVKIVHSATAQKVPTPNPSAPSRVVIPKISVDAPVIYDLKTVNERAFQHALYDGVLHYPGTTTPGEQGNIVIFGHSSGLWWAPGHYKFVFTLLDKLQPNDEIALYYQGSQYIYTVKKLVVVDPNDLSPLAISVDHKLTLITCTPVGTNSKRLIVQADQTYPKIVTESAEQKTAPANKQKNKLPSSSPSIWQSFKDLF